MDFEFGKKNGPNVTFWGLVERASVASLHPINVSVDPVQFLQE